VGFEFEEVGGTFASTLFVPCHDGFLNDSDLTTVDPDAVLSQRTSPDIFHRSDPAAGAHGVSFAPFDVLTPVRATHHRGKWMMAGAGGHLRVVADDRVLLFAVSDHHRRVAVGHGLGQHGVMDHLLRGSDPSLPLRSIERFP
jgi:hypothetical protein